MWRKILFKSAVICNNSLKLQNILNEKDLLNFYKLSEINGTNPRDLPYNVIIFSCSVSKGDVIDRAIYDRNKSLI